MDSNQDDSRNTGLNKRGSDGGFEGGICEEMDASKYDSTIGRQKEIQEIVSALKHVQYGLPSAPPLTMTIFL